jgi:hypothetical protein
MNFTLTRFSTHFQAIRFTVKLNYATHLAHFLPFPFVCLL